MQPFATIIATYLQPLVCKLITEQITKGVSQ